MNNEGLMCASCQSRMRAVDAILAVRRDRVMPYQRHAVRENAEAIARCPMKCVYHL